MRIASSMSWVTKITGLGQATQDAQQLRACRPRPARSGSTAPNGSSIKHDRRVGRRCAARPRPTLWGWPAPNRWRRIAAEGNWLGSRAHQRQHLLRPFRRCVGGGPAQELRHGRHVLGDRHCAGTGPDLLGWDVADGGGAARTAFGARDVPWPSTTECGRMSVRSAGLTMRMGRGLWPQAPRGPISTQVVPSGTSRGSSRSTAGRGPSPGRFLLTFSGGIMPRPRSSRRNAPFEACEKKARSPFASACDANPPSTRLGDV